ncbi:MAG: hypothetical protein AAFY57_19830, partial [Cyanobacteria bacterium J06642_2]
WLTIVEIRLGGIGLTFSYDECSLDWSHSRWEMVLSPQEPGTLCFDTIVPQCSLSPKKPPNATIHFRFEHIEATKESTRVRPCDSFNP